MSNFDQLNQAQRQAVIHDNGPLLIVAGAGTGKTTVLINRLSYLIDQGVAPDKILLVTFTEKGAGELVERADKLLPYGYVDLWISTFHGLAERLLRDRGLDIGLPIDFKILDQTAQWIFVKKHLSEFVLDYYRPLGNPDKFIGDLLKHFSRLKDENIGADDYLRYAGELEQNQDAMLSGAPGRKTADSLDARGKLDTSRVKELADAYHLYNQLLLENKFLDFGDLIVYALKLLRERPQILKSYQNKFAYVMVDEFQDTNYSQYQLLKLLAAPQNNLLAVGDDNQSIFKFRGAALSNIMQFKDDYPTAPVVVLTDNYRSGQPILDRAYDLIKHNDPNTLEVKLHISKRLISQSSDGQARCLVWPDLAAETAGVADLIESWHEGETNWSDLAILVRANATADRFLNELKRRGVPAQFVSWRGLYYKPIILDSLAYCRLLDNYHESGALFRVLNLPLARVNHLDLVNILRFGRTKLWSLFEALTHAAAIPGVSAEAKANIAKLLALIKCHSELAKDFGVSQLFVKIAQDVFLPFLTEADTEEFDYLNQFLQKIKKFEETNPSGLLSEFLELLDWELEAGDTGSLSLSREDADTVKIMTVHTAKGLEFDGVAVADVVDKKFPTINRGETIPLPDALVKESLPESDAHVEEERRLFYVAMTRARRQLVISGALDHGGATLKKPSKFVNEAGLTAETMTSSVPRNELARELSRQNEVVPTAAPRLALPKRFSFSQLESFDRCPWAYKHLHLLKIPTPPKAAMVFGRVMHVALNRFLTPLLSGQADLFGLNQSAVSDLNWPVLKKIYDEVWQDYGYANREEAEAYRRQGLTSLKIFQERLAADATPRLVFLEKKLYPKLDNYALDCVIDRVDQLPDGTVAIIDYKTGEPKLKPTFDDKRQLLFYQLALEQLTDWRVSRLTYEYLKTGGRVSFTAKPEDLDKIRDWIIATIKAIESFDFTPRPEPHTCRYCDSAPWCDFRAV